MISNPVSLVLTDLGMPNLDAPGSWLTIKIKFPSSHVIIMTEAWSYEAYVLARKMGIRYLEKPLRL